ncbi:nucleoporin NUP116/NSP116,putative [Plasmodium sp. gorilla clade G3]|nr:nucleoporin NUP116/NSP116,putative [Plasmodium sp. gorilla clade G3]
MSHSLHGASKQKKSRNNGFSVDVLSWKMTRNEVAEILEKYRIVLLDDYLEHYEKYKRDKIEKDILTALVGIVVKKYIKPDLIKNIYFRQWDVSDFMGNIISVYVNIIKHFDVDLIEEGNMVVLVDPDIYKKNEDIGKHIINFYNLEDIINIGTVAYMHKCKGRNIYEDTCPYLLYVPRQGYFCSRHIGYRNRTHPYLNNETKNTLVFEFPVNDNTIEDSIKESYTKESNTKEDHTQQFSHPFYRRYLCSEKKYNLGNHNSFQNKNCKCTDNDVLSEYFLSGRDNSVSTSVNFFESLSEHNSSKFLCSPKEQLKQNASQPSGEIDKFKELFLGINKINKQSDKICDVPESLDEIRNFCNLSNEVYRTLNSSSGIYGTHKSCDGINGIFKSLNREDKLNESSSRKHILQEPLFSKNETDLSSYCINDILKTSSKKSRTEQILDDIKERIQSQQGKNEIEKTSYEQKQVEKTSCEQKQVEKTSCEQKQVEKTSCEQKQVAKKSCEQKGVEKTSCEQKQVEKKSCEQKEVEKTSREQKGVEKTSCEQKGVEKTSCEQKGVEKTSCEQKGVEKTSCEQKEVEKKSCEQKGVEKTSCEQKGVEKTSCEQKEAEKTSCEQKEAEKTSCEQKEAEKTSCEQNEVEKTSCEQNEVEKTSCEQNEKSEILEKFDKLFQELRSKFDEMERKNGGERDDNTSSSDSFFKRRIFSNGNLNKKRKSAYGTYLKIEEKFGKMNVFINEKKQGNAFLRKNREKKNKDILEKTKKILGEQSINYDIYNDMNSCEHKNFICIDCLNIYRRKDNSTKNSNECGKHLFGKEKKTEDNIKTVLLEYAREKDVEIVMGQEIRNNEKLFHSSVGNEQKLNTNQNEENPATQNLKRPFDEILKEIEKAEKEGDNGIHKIAKNVNEITKNFLYYKNDIKNTNFMKICKRLMLHKSMYIAIIALKLSRKIRTLLKTKS